MDMAASNAVFWTADGWDGSEDMISTSRANCIQQPTKTHVELVSGTSLKTLIVGLQGISAVATPSMGIFHSETHSYSDTISISTIFIPLAVFGLFRLPVAYWLSDDFSFVSLEDRVEMDSTNARSSLLTDRSTKNDSYPPNSWRGLLARSIFMGMLIICWAITVLDMTPLGGAGLFSNKSLCIGISYVYWLTATLLITGFLFFKGDSTTTTIPCVGTVWYKIYTLSVGLLFTITFVAACLETRKTEPTNMAALKQLENLL